MTLFTSISNGSQFLAQNRVSWSYGVALFGLGLVAGPIGQYLILGYAKRTGKNSVLVFAVFFILAVSAVLLLVTAIMTIAADVEKHANFGFKTLC